MGGIVKPFLPTLASLHKSRFNIEMTPNDARKIRLWLGDGSGITVLLKGSTESEEMTLELSKQGGKGRLEIIEVALPVIRRNTRLS